MQRQELGENVLAEIVDGKLVLTADMNRPGRPSRSGKTMTIGTSGGNQPITEDGKTYYLGFNLYRYGKK